MLSGKLKSSYNQYGFRALIFFFSSLTGSAEHLILMFSFVLTFIFIPTVFISCAAILNGRLPTIQQEVQQRKLLYMGLYLLIWGEAANLRFMPECLCYIYHHVCKRFGFQLLMMTHLNEECFSIFFYFMFDFLF